MSSKNYDLIKYFIIIFVFYILNKTPMESIKVLYVSQEILPYLPETDMSSISRKLPQAIQERGKEIRTFMPKYGCINDRRNQLHEVIRLSGMNIIINESDHPLVIKVASIQPARMQVYFIDNEDYFNRKHILRDQNGNFYEDNDERAIFFARGVIETIKKLRWTPDIIHCHGWITSFLPVYIKKSNADNPLFANSKIIYSIYKEDAFDSFFLPSFKRKLMYSGMTEKDLKVVEKANYVTTTKLAINNSDGIMLSSKNVAKEINAYIRTIDKPVLTLNNNTLDVDTYSDFYDTVLSVVVDDA